MDFRRRLFFDRHLQKDGQRILDSVVSSLSKPRLNTCLEIERFSPNPINDFMADLRDAKAFAPTIVLIVGTANEALPFEFHCGTTCVCGIEAGKSCKLSKMTIAKSSEIQKSAPLLNAQSFLLKSIGSKHRAQSPNGAVHIDVDERIEVYVVSGLFRHFACILEDQAFAKGTLDRTGLARIIVANATKNCSTCYIFLDQQVILFHAWEAAAKRPDQWEETCRSR